MKAIRFHEYGGPDVLRYEDVPMPEIGPGDVLVRVHAAGVNPLDWKIRQGYLKAFRPYPLPWILGWDFSGVIEKVGEQVEGWRAGDEVFGLPDLGRPGAYAEYIAVSAKEIARKPAKLDHALSGGIPLTALTAWQALFDQGGLEAGHRVLIHAAAGGVGSFAVQLAKWKGAHVIATGSVRNHDYLRELGADETIDYNAVRFEDVVSGVDVVLDTMAGETRERSWQTLKKGGILVSILGPPPNEETAKAHGVRVGFLWVHSRPDQLAQIAALADEGKLRVELAGVFPLAEAAEAHRLSESLHARGKIVLKVA